MPGRVHRVFRATCPNALWFADLTYLAAWAGFVYVSFVIDVHACRILGWRVSTRIVPTCRSTRSRMPGLVESDYLDLALTCRLADLGAMTLEPVGDADRVLFSTGSGLRFTAASSAAALQRQAGTRRRVMTPLAGLRPRELRTSGM